MTIPQKGWLLVSIPLLAQLVFLGAIFVSRVHQHRTQEKAIHTHKVLGQAESCYRLVSEGQLQMRGFVLTLNPTYLQSYEQARAKIPNEFRELAELVADNPQQQRQVRLMDAQANEFIDWMNENIRLAQKGEHDKILARMQPASGVSHSSELRKRMNDFLDEERSLDEIRMQEREQAIGLQTAILLGGVVLAVVTSFTLLIAFSRSISGRVGTLIENTKRLALGEELAPPLAGSDELRQIDAVFHEMAAALRQKEQENELFVYSVSHDLRSPLVNLQGFSQELNMVVHDLRALINADGVPEPIKASTNKLVDRDAAEAIRFIQSAVIRLSGIIDALMRLSRIGRVEFRLEQIDTEGVVGRVVAALHNSLIERNATVSIGALDSCWGDVHAVDQIFANLIGNAVNYLDASRPGRIEVGMLEGGAPGFSTYFVKDNGLGIPERMQAKAFIAFQRLHPETAPGEGIGLALVRRVVERLGGKVWLNSREGEGSTFFVALPANKDARSTPPPIVSAAPLAPASNPDLLIPPPFARNA